MELHRLAGTADTAVLLVVASSGTVGIAAAAAAAVAVAFAVGTVVVQASSAFAASHILASCSQPSRSIASD